MKQKWTHYQYSFLNSALLLWSAALIFSCLRMSIHSFICGAGAATSLLFYSIKKNIIMFMKKDRHGNTSMNANVSTSFTTPIDKENATSTTIEKKNTIIATGTRFEGNIISTGHIYISGAVYGNVQNEGGMIKIHQNGLLEGEVACAELIVDGVVKGDCRAGDIDILENGKIEGIVFYNNLSVKKGGRLYGQTEAAPEPEEREMKKPLDEIDSPDVKEPSDTELMPCDTEGQPN
ncbi:polymer-forming cytoskeletal protein [Citrobacter sp. ANG330]|uniref:bactofilin family protein n=1 Tax=Citrobacter sp. ANG330 TaxID=3048142 RepID=UPI0039C04A1D